MAINISTPTATDRHDGIPGDDLRQRVWQKSETAGVLADCVHASATGVAILDADNVVVYANPVFAAKLNLGDAAALTGRPPVPAWTPGHAQQAQLLRALGDPRASALTLELGDGDRVTLYLEARHTGQRIVLAASGWPTPEHPPAAPDATIDPLTGLGNRLVYEAQLRRWRDDNGRGLAVILLDLDRFKQINDALGHATGDGLLVLAAKRMRAAMRESDTIVRLGGDEFAVLQSDATQPDGARSAAERLVDVMARPFLIEGHQVNTGASVGVAVLGQQTEKPEDLLRHADLALYESKRRGRSQFCFFEPRLARSAREKRNFELDLRRALPLRQLTLLYQPQKSFTTHDISGFEALIRWQHPRRGLVSPARFIPVAEDIGEIHAIGEWVLQSACQQATGWRQDLNVAVNVSPLQFEHKDIVSIVRKALDRSGLAPGRLELEITESVLMGNSEPVLDRLWSLKDMGVGIAMDDFGTGYASLSYLHSFPFTKLKIDQSFIQAKASPRSKALIEAILAMGTSLGMKTIAEGVETLAQYEELARGGCATAQGYYIAKPMPAEAIAAFIDAACTQNLIDSSTKEATP